MSLSDADLAELSDLEERLWRAETRFDLGWMNEILADDFFEYGRSGRIYSRQECLDIPVGDFSVKLPLADLKIRPLCDDIAQLTYRSEVTINGEMLVGLRSSIWQRHRDGWKLKFHQGTPD